MSQLVRLLGQSVFRGPDVGGTGGRQAIPDGVTHA